jgi:DNA-binding transcriptional LysR family regulator
LSVVNEHIATMVHRTASRPRHIKELKQELEVAGAQATLGLVAVGLGVTIVPQTIAMLPAPGVVFRPLKQRLLYAHVVLWRAKTVSPLTTAFLDGLAGARGR